MAERLPRDFGLARATDAAGSSTPGTLIGTVAYMSPEQVEGLEATEAFDLYALGAVAYQLLTGRVPFEGSIDTVCMKIRNEEPAPLARALRPDGATPAVTPAATGVTLPAAPEAVSMAWSTDSIVVEVTVSASSDIFPDDVHVASAATHWIQRVLRKRWNVRVDGGDYGTREQKRSPRPQDTLLAFNIDLMSGTGGVTITGPRGGLDIDIDGTYQHAATPSPVRPVAVGGTSSNCAIGGRMKSSRHAASWSRKPPAISRSISPPAAEVRTGPFILSHPARSRSSEATRHV